MMKTFLYILVVFVCVSNGYGQDPQFTQFYANPLYLNPAFAGSAFCPRVCINYRNQWPNLSGTYVTYSASYDRYIKAAAGGIGILVTSDDQARGTLKTTTASFMYAYNIKVSRQFSINAALQATYFQKTLDRTKLNFGDMIDPRRGFVWNTNEIVPAQTKRNADFSAGILAYSKHYFFGFAANHLTQPDEGLLGVSKLPAKFTIHGGAIIDLEKAGTSKCSPNILIKGQQKFMKRNLGISYKQEFFVAGLWYRNSDAVIALVGLQSKFLKVGYSYDVTISKLAGNTAGSHEISLQLQLACKARAPKYRLVSCPSF